MPVNVFTPDWNRAESYGRIANELYDHWTANGIAVNCIGDDPPSNAIHPAFGGIVMAYPTNAHTYGPMAMIGPKVFLTMFESTQLPDGWAGVLNTGEAVIVPSHWLVDVFRKSGVRVPIHVIPLGVSEPFREPVARDPDRRPMRFLAIGDRGRRKGWHIAGWAFNKAFGDDPDYEMVFKCRPGSMPFGISNPTMRLVAQEMTDTELADLYRSCDVMVFPTAGEGFGLPPREFAATDGVAIVTDFGGTADDIDRWGIPLTYHMIPAWKGDEKLEGCGQWAEPDIEALADLMRAVADNRKQAFQRAQIMGAWVRNKYQWSTFAEKVYAIWQKVSNANASNRDASHALSLQYR